MLVVVITSSNSPKPLLSRAVCVQDKETASRKKKREGTEAESAFLANLQKTSINYIQSMN